MESFDVDEKTIKFSEKDVERFIAEGKALQLQVQQAKAYADALRDLHSNDRRLLIKALKKLHAVQRAAARWNVRMAPTFEFLKIVCSMLDAKEGTATHVALEEKDDRGS
jgi:hypothetical protein